MEIRQLNSNDTGAYFSIRLEGLKNNPEAFASTYEEEKSQSADKYKTRFEKAQNSFTYGAYEGSEIVGVITLVREQLIKLRHRANIVAMYVKPEKRGNGIGKALMERVIEKARSLSGIEQLYLMVVTENQSARKLYQSMGFEVYGIERKALKYGDTYYDEEQMVLFL